VLLGGEDMDMHKFPVRSPRMDRGELIGSPAAAQQIYLTFPADSTFSEEDVSNYFRYQTRRHLLASVLFGLVSNNGRNRLAFCFDRAACSGRCRTSASPTSRKRMFGFVAFVYAETVKTILNKGNPHFVCNARVLVKPYREKGKVHERLRSVRRIRVIHLHCTFVDGFCS
jgi:hypothetical protein